MTSKWVEAWIDSADGAYLLLVRETLDQKIEIADPFKGNSVIEVFPDYEAALHWLNEDEYDLMEGRYYLDS